MRTTPSRRVLRTVGAALVAMLATAGLASTAQAADDLPVIPDGATGSITIHKFAYPDALPNVPNDGMQHPEITGLTPLDAGFTVRKVGGYDLTKNADWLRLKSLTPDNASQGSLGPELTAGTTSGVVTFANLSVGVYLITETTYPQGAAPAAPFLVTVPMTDPTTDARWVYDIHVYPKNVVSTATKTVADATAATFKNPVVWTILGDIPDVDPIDGYKIVDKLDSALTYKDVTVSLTGTGTPALTTDDYTAVYDQSTHTVTVTFEDTGLATIANRSTEQVKVVIETEANKTGEIPNTAIVYPNKPSFDITPGQPGGPIETPVVETKWGSVSIKKVAQGGQSGLAGAEFALYLSQADAQAGKDAIATDVSDVTTGLVTFTGLRYSGWADGKAVGVGDPGYRTYWLAETKAPDGFELLAQPIEVVVSDDDQEFEYTVENVPSRAGFTLPLTGGLGTATLMIAGVLLVSGSFLVGVRNRRARTATA
ncbi:SpaH/EbpB family LPXTG-anchored major pilin [Xylanimonas allomyrinae]|uniref:SpaH/EbpB family LPXTG-anchored major pilin n=1 Tax=Xylanimonas allomyrinae TaxID=2509459 RepID=UPI0013A5F61E|nr:SpaH/EbpB family LPXTG-anchored major pilin [Xylanimonas allomyrinae]